MHNMFKRKKTKQREGENTVGTSRESQMNGASHASGMSNGISSGTTMTNGTSLADKPDPVSGMTRMKTGHTSEESDMIEVDSAMILQNEDNNARARARMKLKAIKCSKHPGHAEFIPIHDLQSHQLHPPYQNEEWVTFIQLKGQETVLITVCCTSPYRPEDLGFVNMKGTNTKRTGSGTAFIMNMEKIENCDCSEIPGPHKVSGCFKVMTVAHVVFDDEEAQNSVIEFFYDADDIDRSTVVKARGVRVSHVDVQKNRSVIECRTHDLTLYQRLLNARQERIRLIQESLAKQVNHEPMVVLISHPHGSSKCVSIGKLLEIKEEGEIKTTKDGVELVGCILTYDTPTCPGTGGGSINLLGNGEVCFAFAPHCASHSTGKNVSGLGWTKYVKNIQLRNS